MTIHFGELINRKETKKILNVKVRNEKVLETNTEIIQYTFKKTIEN